MIHLASTLFPYTTLFRSALDALDLLVVDGGDEVEGDEVTVLCGAIHAHQGAEALTQLGQAHRSQEHTSELQSRGHLVCRLLLDKKILMSQMNRRMQMLLV